jgi:hypothetical protein
MLKFLPLQKCGQAAPGAMMRIKPSGDLYCMRR